MKFFLSLGPERRQDRLPSCGRLSRLSESRLHWEAPSEWPSGCRSGVLPQDAVSGCLRRRLARTGRRTLLTFMGDSRARIHFEMLRDELGLQQQGRPLAEVFSSQFEASPNVTFETLGGLEPRYLCAGGRLVHYFPETRVQMVACNIVATGPLLEAKFFWHEHMYADYQARLVELAAACESGGACPDLVVLTAGMWYAKFSVNKDVPLQERVLKFRRDAAAMAEGLRSLVRYSTVVYRLAGLKWPTAGAPDRPSVVCSRPSTSPPGRQCPR